MRGRRPCFSRKEATLLGKNANAEEKAARRRARWPFVAAALVLGFGAAFAVAYLVYPPARSKHWRVEVLSVGRRAGADAAMVAVRVEFQALAPHLGSTRAFREKLAGYKGSGLPVGAAVALLNRFDQAIASQELSLFASSEAVLGLPDGSRVSPSLTTGHQPASELTLDVSRKGIRLASASPDSGDEITVRAIRAPGLTLVLVEPGTTYELTLHYQVPITAKEATLRFCDCRPVRLRLVEQ